MCCFKPLIYRAHHVAAEGQRIPGTGRKDNYSIYMLSQMVVEIGEGRGGEKEEDKGKKKVHSGGTTTQKLIKVDHKTLRVTRRTQL